MGMHTLLYTTIPIPPFSVAIILSQWSVKSVQGQVFSPQNRGPSTLRAPS